MRFDILTIFPEFFDGPLDYGILRRARANGLVDVRVEDLREFTHDRHRTVDDRPFGGGEGMVLKPEPLFEAVEAISGAGPALDLGATPGTIASTPGNSAIVLLSASGKLFNEAGARRLSKLDRVVLICGRYEGVDERVAEHLATEEICIGDFVLSGGELPAAVVVDAVTRLLPGALGNDASAVHESFSVEISGGAEFAGTKSSESPEFYAAGAKNKIVSESAALPEWLADFAGGANFARGGILDCPHFTRPAEFRGWPIPEVLNGGNHEHIRLWRRRAALAKTLRNRPELLAHAALSREEVLWLEELHAQTRGKSGS